MRVTREEWIILHYALVNIPTSVTAGVSAVYDDASERTILEAVEQLSFMSFEKATQHDATELDDLILASAAQRSTFVSDYPLFLMGLDNEVPGLTVEEYQAVHENLKTRLRG